MGRSQLERRLEVERLEDWELLSATPVGPEFRVNTYSTNHQYSAVLGLDASGNFVVAWTSVGQDGSGEGIYAQRYNAAGVSQGSEFRVNTYIGGAQWYPSVAMDADGDFVVVWESTDQDGSGRGVYAQRYDALGVPQESEFQVNTYTTDWQSTPAVAMDGAGNFVIAWASRYQDGSNAGIYAQRYNASGTPLGAEFRVNTHTTGGQSEPAVAVDASGNFIVTWTSYGQDGSRGGIYAQRYDASGTPQGTEFRVNSYTTDWQAISKVAIDASGDFIVAWQSGDFFGGGQDGSRTGVYAQRYDALGVPQGSEFRVNTYTSDRQSGPAIAMDSAGNFVLAWSSYGQDGSNYGVYARSYSAAGDPDGIEFRVNSYTTSSQGGAAISMSSSGNFAVAWSSFGQDGSNNGVYAQRYTSAPVNQPPTANAGGTYSVAEGQALVLAGSGSDPEGGPLAYAWDLNNDGVYGDAVGAAPTVTWAELTALGIQDGPSTWTVRVRVTDQVGAWTISDPTSLSVTNAPPVSVGISFPSPAVRGELANFTFTASDPGPTDQAANFTFQVDWDGNGTFDQAFSGPSGQVVGHTFANSGVYNVRVKATDKDGGVSPVTTSAVNVVNWALRQDPFDSSKTNLIWGGTNGFDAYYFIFPGLVLIQAQNNAYFSSPQSVFTGGFNGKVYVYAQGAGDLVFADVMSASMVIDGGDGDDVLIGGRGADRILGGNGNDILFGGTLESDAADELFGDAGDDLLVGHFGADALFGGTGQDLIIAGRLNFADLPGAVFGIQAEWTSGRPIAERVANLTGTGTGPRNNGDTFLIPGATALDDSPLPPAVVDLVIGDDQDDWLIYDFADDLNLEVEPGDVSTNLG